MNQVRSQNNSGLFRSRRSPHKKKKQHGRLFIRRSKIDTLYSPPDENLTINYRPQWRHRRIRRRILNGEGDEKISTPSSSIDQKQMDFTELEQIFDNAIRNRLPLELYKEKPPTKELVLTPHENLRPLSVQPLIEQHPPETRINLSIIEPMEEMNCCLIANIKQHKILSAITCVTFCAFLGFFSVLIFVQPF